MSEERDWAAFYREHKDDPEIWGEPEMDTAPAPRRALSATITVRFSPEEASEIRTLAKKLGISYSDIIRRAVQEFVHPHAMTKYITCGLPLGDLESPQSEREGAPDIFLTNAKTATGSLDLARA
jgi:mobilization protein NikA